MILVILDMVPSFVPSLDWNLTLGVPSVPPENEDDCGTADAGQAKAFLRGGQRFILKEWGSRPTNRWVSSSRHVTYMEKRWKSVSLNQCTCKNVGFDLTSTKKERSDPRKNVGLKKRGDSLARVGIPTVGMEGFNHQQPTAIQSDVHSCAWVCQKWRFPSVGWQASGVILH